MTIVADVLEECDKRKAESWKDRPDPLPLIEFARTLTTPDSEDEHGNLEPYDPRSHPGQLIILKALDGHYDRPGRPFRKFIFIGDAQGAGKSWMLQIAAFHSLIERGQNLIYALPTRDLGGDVWSLKLRPAFLGAGLGSYLPLEGPGSKHGSKPRFIPTRRLDGRGGGTLVFMAAGGRGQSGQASLTAKRLIVDEVEDWTKQALNLIQNRISRYNQTAQQFYACTINKNNRKDREEDDSNILPMHNAAVKGRCGYTCPHCSKVTRLEPARFVYSGFTEVEWKATAAIICEHCDARITEDQRTIMLANADLVMEQPDKDDFSLLMNALDCPWKPLHWLAGKAHAAKVALDMGDEEPMRQLFNKEWSLQFAGIQSEHTPSIDVDSLLRRSHASTWGPTRAETDRLPGEDRRTHSRHIAPVPRECQFITVAVDVQADQIYWLMLGMDNEERQWDVAWGYEYATADRQPTNKMQLWSILERVDSITRILAGVVPIVRRGVDANYRADDVLPWLQNHFEWVPTYGASAAKAAQMTSSGGKEVRKYPGILFQKRSEGWKLRQDRHHIDTNPMRLRAQRSFLLQPGLAGAAHLPSGLTTSATDRAYLRHLCAEVWDESKNRWVPAKGGGRWDWLDCRVYAFALGLLHLRHGAQLGPPRPPPSDAPEDRNWMGGIAEDWNIPP